MSGMRRATPFVLLVTGVVFGLALAAGVDFTTPSHSAAPVQAAQSVDVPRATLGALQGLPSFADLSDAVLPAVVSIEATKIERGSGPRRGQDPFEFFFRGPQRRAPGDEGGDSEPEEFRSDSGGSGFVISADGLIVTNNHVIDGATRLRVHLGNRFYEATVKGTDPSTDLALLKIEGPRNLRFLELGDSERLRVGDWVVAIGNPLLLEQTVTVGVVSAKNRSIGINDTSFENFIQTDAAISRGNSGGPLVNLAGEVVGIATAMNWGAENIGFAVPSDTLKEILPQLREKGRVSRGFLGIRIGNLTYEDAQAWGLETTDGALVSQVDPDTPASRAGVRHGDIILRVDGRPIRQTRDLINYVSARGPGAEVELDILRDGKPVEARVKLGERDADDEAEDARAPERDSGTEWLGLDYQDLTSALRRAHGIPEDLQGVWINDVSPRSPLVEEDIREGDVIAEVNGRPVEDADDFERIVTGAASGSYLRLYVRRIDPRGGRAAAFFATVRVP
jgi:serine protease Do